MNFMESLPLVNKEEIITELIQLGLIIESLDHEYNKLFSDIESDFLKLKSDPNFKGSTLEHLHNGFSSLRAKLSLLSPLYRTKIGFTETVNGLDIRSFLDHLYPMDKHTDVDFIYTPKFLEREFKMVHKPSILASVANIVKNSLYWVEKTVPPHFIKFSVVPYGIVISDTGPGIDPTTRHKIFEPFFSTRPYGRGLGLYISMLSLSKNNLKLIASEKPVKEALNGANFIIRRDIY